MFLRAVVFVSFIVFIDSSTKFDPLAGRRYVQDLMIKYNNESKAPFYYVPRQLTRFGRDKVGDVYYVYAFAEMVKSKCRKIKNNVEEFKKCEKIFLSEKDPYEGINVIYEVSKNVYNIIYQ